MRGCWIAGGKQLFESTPGAGFKIPLREGYSFATPSRKGILKPAPALFNTARRWGGRLDALKSRSVAAGSAER